MLLYFFIVTTGMFIYFAAVGLVGNKSAYEVGSTASVICYTNLTVVTIRWLIQSSKVSFRIDQIRDNELRLKVNSGISKEADGTNFTCEVLNRLPIGTTATSTAIFTIKTFFKGTF